MGGAFLTVVLVILLLAVGLLVFLRTETAKSLVADRLSGYLSSGPDRTVSFERVEIQPPLQVRVKGVTLGDTEGTWLAGKDLTLRMSLFDLLGRKFHFEEISASSVDIKRLPRSQKPEEAKESQPIALPERLPPITVDRLNVDELILEEPVSSRYAVFRLEGKIAGEAGSKPTGNKSGLQATLHASRTDNAPDTSLDLSAAIYGEPYRLGVQVELREEAGGWIASTLNREDDGPLFIQLRGDGPLDDWNGSLQGNIHRYGSINSDIGLAVSPPPTVAQGAAKEQEIAIALKGVMDPSRDIFSPQLTPILGGESRFELNARYALPSRLAVIESAKIQGAEYSAQVEGRLNLDSQAIQSSLNISIGDLKAMEALAGMPLAGRLSFTGNVANTLQEPQCTLTLRLDGLQAENFHAGQVQADVRMEPYDTSRGGTLNATLRVNDFRMVAESPGQAVSGNGTVEVHLAGNPVDGNAAGTIRGHLEGMEGLSPAVASLSGPRLDFGGNAELHNKTLLDVSQFQITGSNLRLGSTASVNLAEKAVKGNWRITIPGLEAPARALGKRMSGSMEAEGEINGPFNSLETTLSIRGNKVKVEGVEIQQPSATIHVQGLPEAPRGDVRLQMRQSGRSLNAAAEFMLQGQRLSLPHLSLDAPRNQITGNLNVDLAGKQAEGNLEGKLTDLSVLGRFIGERLGGSATFSIRPSRNNGSQNVKLLVDGKGLVSPYASAGKVSVSADLKDVLNKPLGTASIQARDVKGAGGADGFALRTLSLKVSGDTRGGSFDGAAAGRYSKDFDLRTQGDVTRSSTSEQVRVKSLSGHFGDYALQLQQPAILGRGQEGFVLDGLVLTVGEARLQATGRYSPRTVSLNAQIDKLSLAMAGLFGAPELPGTLSGRIRMEGNPGQPTVNADMNVTGLRPPADRMPNAPTIAVSATARLEGGKMNARAEIQGPFEGPAVATLSIPVRFAVAPFAFVLPPEGSIQGHVEAQGNLATLAALVPREDQQLAGKIKLLFDIGGTMASPETNGSAAIENGTYTNFNSGTTLKNLNVEVTARGRRLEIRRAESNDGGSGTISATGWVELDPARKFPLEAEVSVVNATLVRREEVTGSVGGDLKVTGNIVDMAMSGKLDIIGAEASIPRQVSTSIAKLDVIEINGPISKKGKTAAAQAKTKKTNENQDKAQVASPAIIRLNITVASPGRVFIRGKGLNSEWKGDLQISGTASEPSIKGTLSVVRGYLDFLDKRFNLTEGIIRFHGESPPSPTLDLVAEAKTQDITARISLTGSAASPKVEFQSDPPLPQDEVLSRVLFGRELGKITPVQALKLANALRVLSGGSDTLGFLTDTRKFLGVEQLDIRTPTSNAGSNTDKSKNTSDVALGIGKYLTEDVYVDVEKGVGNNSGKVTVQVEITPNLSLETQTGLEGNSGIGVNWKHDY